MRINITGNAASGKTTLAARIGAVLGIPVYSLDLPHPCPEIAIVPRLLRLIYRFHKNGRPQIRLEATQEPHRIRVHQHPVSAEAIIKLIRELPSERVGYTQQTSP